MSTPRRTRADAERNRLRVLEVARALFAERGDDVQMPEVARAAGVGIGTVYRHFPSRRALVEAAAEHRFAQIADFARACRRSPDGLAQYLSHVGEILSGDPGLNSAIQAVRGTPETEPRGDAFTELEDIVGELIEQGKDAGTLRPDLTTADVYLLVAGLSAVIRTASGDWRRYLELILHGLGPDPRR